MRKNLGAPVSPGFAQIKMRDLLPNVSLINQMDLKKKIGDCSQKLDLNQLIDDLEQECLG